MKRLYGIPVLALMLVVAAAAAEPDPLAELDKALEAVKAWGHGEDTGPLKKVEDVVVAAAKDPGRRDAVEQRLVSTLQSASTRDARAFICRQLRTIGTVRSVPALEALLTDKDISFMARYALGRIEDVAAADALYRAMPKTSGKLQAGIISTLSARGYTKALGDFVKLIKSSDATVSEAAALAVGRIGGADAVKALEAARPKASGALRKRIDDALLKCAEQLLRDGRSAEASRIYRTFYSPKEPGHVRLGALRGLAAARGAEAAPLIAEAIRSDDAQLRASAIAFMTMVKGSDATKVFVAMLPTLPPEGQELVVRSLGNRGETSAAAAITAATKSEHEAVRLAAIEALGRVGDASSVGLLAQVAAAAKDKEQRMARASLLHLRGDKIDAALIRSVGAGDAKVRVEVIRALAGRKAKAAMGELLKAAGDDDKSVRREAIRAVGALAGEKDLKTLVSLVVKAKDADDRSAAEQALGTAFMSIGDRDKRAAPVLAALRSAPADAKPMLVGLLRRCATAKSLEAVRAALKDKSDAVREAAIRTLASWPDATPAKELLSMARSASSQTHKVLFLRGYVRMAGMSPNPTGMYIQAMALARRPDDKKLVLAGLGTASSADALKIAEKYLSDKDLQAEAGLAVTQIAEKLRAFDAARAKTALRNVIATVENASIRKKAQEVINDMEKYQGYVLTWLGSGPYTRKGKNGSQLFDIAFGPEKGDKDVKWKRITRGVDSWGINLEAAFGGLDHCAAYVRTRVFSPVDQAARLELGSDDSITVWLNGKRVHANNCNRGMNPRQDLVNVKLKKGWNVLLLKVIDNSGGWAFCCRIRNAEGAALEGLKTEAK